jgi:excisionase family DNA binding protein
MSNSHPPIASTRMCREPLDRHFRTEFESLVTPAEASAYLRVHPKTIIRLARQRAIPALRIGKHWRFRLSDLIDWTETKVQSACQPVE